jgi:hypothetical protein
MAETHTGEVRNGVVVIDAGTPRLPDETKVRIEPEHLKAALRDLAVGLRSLAGRAEGLPEDMAENLNHYLHGQPKS